MELKSFREILLKKAEGNPTLQTLIAFTKDEIIAEKLMETLEKMARPNASMGRGANAAVVALANRLTNKDVEMMRDALGHHVSHYKAALKNKNREVADKHLNKIIPLMHLAGKMAPHSGGQLALDYVPTEAWETNYTRPDRRPETGKLKEGTKGLGRRPAKKTTRNPFHEEHPEYESHKGNAYGVPDYKYLEMPPHPGHADYTRIPHEGGYPFEEIQIGNPTKVDAGEAYLHVHDPGKQDKYVPHSFDYHPIHPLADIKQGVKEDKLPLGPDDPRMEKFVNDLAGWHDTEHSKNWLQGLKEQSVKDPEGFKARGKAKPEHHFTGIDLQPHEHHVLHHVEKFGKPEKVSAKTEKVKSEQPAAPVEKPKVAVKQAQPKIDFSALPPDLVARFKKGSGE